ncbi:hypothetical protein ACS0TY_011344 [Phlomoides rotata]
MNFMSGRSGFYEEMSGISSDRPEDPSDDHLHLLRRVGGEGSSAASVVVQREHMFDKVVTPSDVGKLNRLVIPKQHAEKYFPLDSSTNEKGLLLNFEDRNGKPWRFRYSYWNSSQSYVMTKGWSRFVKEKKLDAGDIVSFHRGLGEVSKDRLFIDWRRRPDAPEPIPISHHQQFSFHHRSLHPWSPLYIQPTAPPSRDYLHHHHFIPSGYGTHPYSSVVNGSPCPPGSIVYLRGGPPVGGGGVFGAQQQGGGGVAAQMVFDSVPVVQGKAAAKRLRLFGVNMDCPISETEECDDILSSTSLSLPLHHHLPPPPPAESPRSNSNDDYKGKGSMSLDLDI